MHEKKIESTGDVIYVNFTDSPASGVPSGETRYPMEIVAALGEKAFLAVRTEEALSGLDPSTITNRALQLYHLIMERQRSKEPVGFLDPATMTMELISIEDPHNDNPQD